MTDSNTLTQPWTPIQKWGFRFSLLFFISFIFFNPNGAVPLLSEAYEMYIIPMHKLVVWAGTHLLHLPKPINNFTNGSGDTLYDWLVLLFITVMSLAAATVWSLVNQQPMSYDRLYYWLLVILRFYVGFTMISYGGVKVIKLQFPMPRPGRLAEAYGDSSPMGLAWTFMGYSKPYNYFTGIAELSCGILLLFRRTVLIGAVIAFTVIANIAAINYCFDVPVKIVSSLLLLMVIFILLKDLHRITKFFFLNQAAEPAILTPRRFKKRWKNVTLVTVKYLLIIYMMLSNGSNLIESMKYGDDAPKPLMSGIFNVNTFVLGKDTLPPLTTDTLRWRRIIISTSGNMRVYLMNDSIRIYAYKNDEKANTITINKFADTVHKYTFKYTLSKKDSTLLISGEGPAGTLSASLKRYDEKKFLLMRRGFHLVNETPFNK